MKAQRPKPELAPSCGDCKYHQGDKTCHRHAPSPMREDNLVANWMFTPDQARCGSGILIGTGDILIQCQGCIDWRPGAKPEFGRRGRSNEWWENAGHCTRFPPAAGYESERVYWMVTHATETCGDGRRPPDNEDEAPEPEE